MSDNKDKLDAPAIKDLPEKKAAHHREKGEKKKKKNIFARIGGFFARWFKELKSEAKKVAWPGFKSVVNNTLVVLAMMAILGGLIILVDFALKNGLGLIING